MYLPAERFTYRVRVALPDGAVCIEGVDGGPAAGPVDGLRAMARSLGRDALAREPVVWPRRLLRWRAR